MADVTEVLNKAENKEELKAVLSLSAKQESEIFQQITAELAQQNDFEAFLNRKVHFDNRDWTYGQFLYKHCFDEVQKFTYKCKDYFDGKPVANFGETEKNLAQKVAFIFSNNLAQPDGVLQTEKLKELDIFNGDKEKEAFYQNLFANSNRSVEGNPCYLFARLIALFGADTDFNAIKYKFFIILGLIFFAGITQYVVEMLGTFLAMMRLRPIVRKELSADLFAYLMGHSVGYYADNMAGSLAQKWQDLADDIPTMYRVYKGKIIEQGKIEDLLKSGGQFQHLWEIQQ